MLNSLLVNPSFFNIGLPNPIRTTTALGNWENIDAPVCLTFDDGPDPVYTQKILDILADYHVTATFFVVGKSAQEHPHLVEQMLKAGHSIGNHSYNHCHPWMISSKSARQEVTHATSVIKMITGSAPRWFRPPFGRLRPAMRNQAHAEQMATVLWNHSIIDWGPLGTEAGVAKRLKQIKAGDIVLMHDGKRESNHPNIIIQYLPGFLQLLQEKSLSICSLDDVAFVT
jgi:peptidoglycan-N-acetylglucosamine deacetylase